MRMPKMLPWLACRAGIPLTRAEAFWGEASLDAMRMTASAQSSQHSRAAVRKLLELLDAENKSFRRPHRDQTCRPCLSDSARSSSRASIPESAGLVKFC